MLVTLAVSPLPSHFLLAYALYLCPPPPPHHQSLHHEDGGNIASETLVSYHYSTQHYNPENFDLNLHHYENLKSHIKSKLFCIVG
jgi:hypothetical protein